MYSDVSYTSDIDNDIDMYFYTNTSDLDMYFYTRKTSD